MSAGDLYNFFIGWKNESNPWREAYNEGGGVFERSFAWYFLLFLILNYFGIWVGRTYGRPFSSRPGFFAATFHCAATSFLALYVLAFKSGTMVDGVVTGEVDYSLWREVALPLSIGYFMTDIFIYCIPKKDMIITFHHIIMVISHYPVVHDAGAHLAGAGDINWVTWLSIVGYTSEVSTVLMNYRWYLLQTLEENWIGFGMVNISIVISWAARVVLFAYLLIWEIAPRAAVYAETKQVLTYSVMVLGHFVIGLLSLYWLGLMCRGGLKGLITFKKPTPSKDGSFSFGGDIGRDSGEVKKRKSLDAAASGVAKAVAKESQAWVDGAKFNEETKAKKL